MMHHVMPRLKIPLYLLENVMGITRCLNEICDHLVRELPDHYHCHVKVNRPGVAPKAVLLWDIQAGQLESLATCNYL